MPYVQPQPLDALASVIADLQRRVTILESRSRSLGNGSLTVTDNNNDTVMVIGNLGNGAYGVQVLDDSGNTRTQMGKLPSGDYGLEVLDASGNGGEILPQYNIYGAGPYSLSTSGTSALGVSESVPIGASGSCYVTLQGLLISTATNGVNSKLILYVNGTATGLNIQSYDNNSTTGIAQISLSGRALITGLTAGASSTFAVYGTSSYGAEAENVSIQVQPV